MRSYSICLQFNFNIASITFSSAGSSHFTQSCCLLNFWAARRQDGHPRDRQKGSLEIRFNLRYIKVALRSSFPSSSPHFRRPSILLSSVCFTRLDAFMWHLILARHLVRRVLIYTLNMFSCDRRRFLFSDGLRSLSQAGFLHC